MSQRQHFVAGPGVVELVKSPGAEVAVPDPGLRGTLVVADRVVEKIAETAAAEVPHTVALGRRVTDLLPGRRAAPARAEAIVSGRRVQLRVTVAIEYPTPLAVTTRAVRSHVRDVVTRLCAVEVRHVDVDVAALRRPAERRRRVQ